MEQTKTIKPPKTPPIQNLMRPIVHPFVTHTDMAEIGAPKIQPSSSKCVSRNSEPASINLARVKKKRRLGSFMDKNKYLRTPTVGHLSHSIDFANDELRDSKGVINLSNTSNKETEQQSGDFLSNGSQQSEKSAELDKTVAYKLCSDEFSQQATELIDVDERIEYKPILLLPEQQKSTCLDKQIEEEKVPSNLFPDGDADAKLNQNQFESFRGADDEEEAEPIEMKTNFLTDKSETSDLDELKTFTYKARSKCKTSTSTCRKCGREVSNKQMEFLHSHINSKHLKLPLYTCPICQMDFYGISYANPLTHLRKRHGQENATASDLIDHRPKHMTTITSQKLFHQHFGASKVKGDKKPRANDQLELNEFDGENDKDMIDWNDGHDSDKHQRNTFVCKKCGKRVSGITADYLRAHINGRHLKLALYICPIEGCRKEFYRNLSWNSMKHVENQHGQVVTEEQVMHPRRGKHLQALKDPILLHFYFGIHKVETKTSSNKTKRQKISGSVSSKCRVCKDEVFGKQHLHLRELNHINRKHMHLTIFECRLCGQKLESLLQWAAAKIHLRRVHRIPAESINPKSFLEHFICSREEAITALESAHQKYFND